VLSARRTAERLCYQPHFLADPHTPEYWNPQYVLINFLKPGLVCRAYEDGLLEATETAAWIDFGYCDREGVLGASVAWEYDFTRDRIHLFALREPDAKRPIFDVVRTGSVYLTGGQIVADRASWLQLRDGYASNLEHLLRCGLVDDDQTLLLMCYIEAPQQFELHYILPRQGWRAALRHFNRAWVPHSR
jgi:hypothetical protein